MFFLIRIAPEISIKSDSVRRRMVRFLRNNIQKAMSKISSDIHVSGGWDKIELQVGSNELLLKKQIIQKLQKIPGIAFALEAEKILIPSEKEQKENNKNSKIQNFLEILGQEVVFRYSPKIEGKTFCVRVKRGGVHPFTSPEAERFLGACLLKNTKNTSVKMVNPEILIQLEIQNNEVLFITEKILGMGGFPMGVQEKVLMLLSGGFDSGVASYLMMKRGVRVDYVFFNMGGDAHEVGVKQLAFYLAKEFSDGFVPQIYTVNFEEVVKELLTKIKHSFRGVLLKRMMVRAASEIAKKRGSLSLVTGESIAQVSSQTIPNLNIISEASHKEIFRPLLTYDKIQIIEIAEKIGTANFARSMPEYCGIISDRPTIAAKKSEIEEQEALFDFQILERAIFDRKEENVLDVETNIESVGEVEVVYEIGENQRVIDIRDPEVRQKNLFPISVLQKEEIIAIPFFDLAREFLKLDSSKTYLFYCEKGVLSKLHALHLFGKGFTNIKILR